MQSFLEDQACDPEMRKVYEMIATQAARMQDIVGTLWALHDTAADNQGADLTASEPGMT